MLFHFAHQQSTKQVSFSSLISKWQMTVSMYFSIKTMMIE